MSIPSGKGIFIWNLGDVGFGSDMVGLVNFIVDQGITHVTVKILQSVYDTWGNFTPRNKDLLPEFITECKVYGIQVGGYQYIVGYSNTHAAAEGDVAVDYAKELGLDFFVIDAESEYKAPGSASWASVYMSYLGWLPFDIHVGLASYRYPSVHPEFPWQEFLLHEWMDFHMPQVYWAGTTSQSAAGNQLQKSYDELIAIRNLPFVPIGSAYCEGGWCATPEQIVNFWWVAYTMNLPGISFWDMRHAYYLHQELGAAITGIEWDGEIDPPPDPVEPPPSKEVLFRVRCIYRVKIRQGSGANDPHLGDYVEVGEERDVYAVAGNSTYDIRLRIGEEEWSALSYKYWYGIRHFFEVI